MGMKEKTRQKEKENSTEESIESGSQIEETANETEDEREETIHTPKVSVDIITNEVTVIETEKEQVTLNETLEIETEDTTEGILPTWGHFEQSEWMYGIPSREEDQILWANEWADFLLQWSEYHSIHVLSVASFISEPPFKDLRNKVDSFKIITQVLIDKEIAEWMDNRKRQLRIYWRPLEDWADYIYAWALRTGKIRLDVKSIVIQESTEDFAKLPEKDLYIVLALMVEKGLAQWVDKKQGAIIINS